MNFIIEQKLDKVQSQWKWLKFGQHLGTLGAALCLIWFLIQLSVWREIVESTGVFISMAVIFGLAAFVSVGALAVYILVSRPDRTWVAGAVEKSHPGLMDRINTLVFLEGQKSFHWKAALSGKIQKQAEVVLVDKPSSYPFAPAQTLVHLGTFAVALGGVIFFQLHFDPFAKLKSADTLVTPPKEESPFELKAGNAVETVEKKAWGEVRIIEPGRDLKMTKVDVIPLQIEMTASEAMEKPAWITSLNGGEEIRHDLEKPSEPNYAVYQPILYLDELKVSDWDVVSYFARVESCAPAEYTSKIYFIEIRPFRDDVLKMTRGGEGKGNKAYELLNEITGLVKRQTEILQDTHQYQQIKYPNEELQVQDRKKLAAAEGDLHTAADQLYATIATEQENAPVGDVLDHLASAEEHMDKGAEALRDDAVPEGKQREQKALAELVSMRKTFQKMMMEHPDAFGSSGENDNEDEPIAVADSQKALQQVSEMKDREQAAIDAMKQLSAQQQALTNIAKTRIRQKEGSATTAKAQSDLKNRLERLIEDNPDLFRGTGKEQEAVRTNMDNAINSLNEEDWDSVRNMTRSAETMRDLEKAVIENHERQKLTQAYELKKIIDQNIKQLKKEEGSPGTMSNEEAKALADSAQRSTGALKEIADSGGASGMGSELGEALSPENQETLRKSLEKFTQSQSKEERRGSAGEAGKNLAKVSQAFDQSRPGLTKQMRNQDNLQSHGGDDALGQAQQQLRSMMLAQEQNRPFTPENQSKAMAEILQLLKEEEKDAKPDEAHALLVAKMEKMLEKKKGLPVDPEAFKKLIEEIEAVRMEIKDQAREKPPEAATTQVDPSKYPPSYRERIKRYFEQLSAMPH